MTESAIGAPPRRWSVPEARLAIEYSPEALREILAYTRRAGVGSVAQRPLPAAPDKSRNSPQKPPAASPFCASYSGTGGVLFGARGENLVRIVTWRPMDTGPIGLERLLRRAKASPALAELHPVGWFVSHTRGEIALTASDLDVFNHYFPWSWQIALVLKLSSGAPARAGFFVRDAHGTVKSDSSYREFEIEIPPPAPAKKHVPDRRLWIWIIPLLLAAAVLAVLLHRPSVRPPLGPISFRVVDTGGELQLQWDKTADAVRGAVRASIEIKDGDTDLDLPLDLDRLRTGRFAYTRKSGDVELLMTVYPAHAPPVQESARVVAPSASVPAGEAAAQLGRERDAYAAENARLRESLDKEKDRNRELERLARILESRLGIDRPTSRRAGK